MSCDRKIGPYPGLEPRFWMKVMQTAGCWEWTGAKGSHGYGIIMYRDHTGRRALLAHRVAYQFEHGRPIPKGMTIDHLCRNRGCVNPAHLEVVTQRENNMRAPTCCTLHALKSCCPKCGGEYEKQSNGERRCIPCRLARRRERYANGERGV